jgi:hypothetical protein
MRRSAIMTSSNGVPPTALELGEKLFIQVPGAEQTEYEVVGILDDADGGDAYAVLVHEGTASDGSDETEDVYIVTDLQGKLIETDELAQEILDDFMVFSEEAAGEPIEAGLEGAPGRDPDGTPRFAPAQSTAIESPFGDTPPRSGGVAPEPTKEGSKT